VPTLQLAPSSYFVTHCVTGELHDERRFQPAITTVVFEIARPHARAFTSGH